MSAHVHTIAVHQSDSRAYLGVIAPTLARRVVPFTVTRQPRYRFPAGTVAPLAAGVDICPGVTSPRGGRGAGGRKRLGRVISPLPAEGTHANAHGRDSRYWLSLPTHFGAAFRR